MPQLDLFVFLDVYVTLVIGLLVMYILCGYYIIPLIFRNVYVEKKMLARMIVHFNDYIQVNGF